MRVSAKLPSLLLFIEVLLASGPLRGEATLVEKLRDEGMEHYRARRYYQALRSLETAFDAAGEGERPELKGLLARVHSAVGVELFNSGELRRSENAFRQALTSAEDSYAHFGLGFLHFVRLEDAEAEEHLTQSIRLEPTHGKTHKLLALLDYRQGRTAQAITKIAEAARLDPEDRETLALRDRWTLESRTTKAFTERTIGRFHLRIDPELPPARVDAVVKVLETARRDAMEILGLKASSRIVVVLFVEERFHKATGSYHWVGGMFDGQIKLPVRAREGDQAARNELIFAVRHEMAHAAVRQVCPECPNWLNEGIAQYFEDPARRDSARKLLKEGAHQRIAFQQVPSRLWGVDDEALARWTYLQGLGFVEFLVARFQPFRLRLCLEALRGERSLEKAFEMAYGQSLEALEDLWWKEING
ncbi:MAG TPA: hypothetical protein VMT52_02915 [Planctomycetota bacterium]|nr:hypothetical protein [Planctomycetota bacterium]